MPPFPGIPYGVAPTWCFPVFEVSIFALFFFCLSDAMKRGKRNAVYLLGGTAFGLVLEYVEVNTGSGYIYGRFLIMLGQEPNNIPLCIGAGWGIIMYSARLFSDSFGMPLSACAALDTLLALNVDASMDTIAYRLHMWHWDWSGTRLNPLTAQWFGVPYGNFAGWQMVVFAYSLFSRLLERKIAPRHDASVGKCILTALLALICSQAVLFAMESYIEHFLYVNLGITSLHRVVVGIVICGILLHWGWRKRRARATGIPMVTWLVPGWFHLFFFSCLFLAGFYKENRWMTIASIVSLLLGIFSHTVPLTVKNAELRTNL
jgi:uncharacterized membrane protein